jgi:uncharacterized repeat protein (TIGR01451 family)
VTTSSVFFSSRVRRAAACGAVLLAVGAVSAAPAAAKPSTDVAIHESVDLATPAFGQEVVLTTVIENLGSVKATGVKPTVAIPNGLRVVNWSDGNPKKPAKSYDPNTGVWNVKKLLPGAHATLTITARAGDVSIGARNVTATVHAKTADPDLTNNVAGATVTSEQAPLQVTITPDPGNPAFPDLSSPGSIGWTVSVANPYDSSAPITSLATQWFCSTDSANDCPLVDGLTHGNEPHLSFTLSSLLLDRYLITAFAATGDPNYIESSQTMITFTTIDSGA